MLEDSKSLESQLKMARPRRHEVKRVPLTDEEKEFLGEIMDKAVAAEKAGELQQALHFYTDYKNELLMIKERRKIEWTREKLENWVEKNVNLPDKDIDIKKMTADIFDLSKLPKLETKESLPHQLFKNKKIEKFPANITVNGDFMLFDVEINEWVGSGLIVNGRMWLKNAKIEDLPNNTEIERDLRLISSSISDLPDDLRIKHDIWITNCSNKLVKKAQELREKGMIKGDIY